MSTMPRAFVAVVAFAVALGLAGPSIARQDDPRLDQLFETLRELDHPAIREVRTLEAWIWTIWGESGSETIDLLYASGIDAMRERRLTDARDIFGEIIALDPAFAEGWNRRATVHFLLRDYDQSIADVEQTLALEPRHFGALTGLGQIYMRLDRPKDALDAMRAGLKVHPHMPGIEAFAEELRKRVEGEGI